MRAAEDGSAPGAGEAKTKDRRGFLANVLMWSGLGLGYGIGFRHFLHYLVPLGGEVRYREMYVGSLDDLPVGKSRRIKTPTGESFVMARTEDGLRVLSDICPHLGCRVHWVAKEGHFLCPCHQGIFDPEGVATAGPPADAGQSLARLETVVRGRSVFVLIKEA